MLYSATGTTFGLVSLKVSPETVKDELVILKALCAFITFLYPTHRQRFSACSYCLTS